jgi:hypothetical protein
MRRILFIIVLLCSPVFAQFFAYNGQCMKGGQAVVMQGLKSSATTPISPGGPTASGTGVLASYPSCTVGVFLTGTISPATIFSDPGGSIPKGVPFTANTDGSFLFFAAGGIGFDITMSGGGIPGSYTLTDIILGGGSGGSGGLAVYTVAGLNTIPGKVRGTLAAVSDGLTSSDCSVGGGTTEALCQYTGSSWVSVGAGGTVTSVGLSGTANQITVTGATPVTGSGNWTLTIPSPFNPPGDVNAGGAISAVNGLSSGAGALGCGAATGCIAATEGATAGTPTAGSDYIRADSVTHQWVQSINGGAEGPLSGGAAPQQALPASPLINQGASSAPVYAAGITYATTAQNWSQTGITTSLTGGSASSLTLNAGFSGLDVASGFGYQVLISDGANSEAVNVTGGTYTFAGGGTILFTPFFNHGPGAYTVSSASSGVQETLNTACGMSASNTQNGYCNVTLPASGVGFVNYNYQVQGTIFVHTNQSVISGYGAILSCTGRGTCLQVGDRNSSNHFIDNTIKGISFQSPTDFSANHSYAGVQITNTVKTAQVVTITTATAHGFRIGDMVTVLFTDNNAYWGDSVVTSVPTATTFTYAHSGADILTQATPGVVALAYSAILDNGEHSHLDDLTYFVGGENGKFNNFFDMWDDENAAITTFNNNAINLFTGPNWTGSFVFSAGNQGSLNQIAPVISFRDSNLTANSSNGVTIYNSNGLYIENTVLQATGPWQVYSSNSTGNYQGAALRNIYSESSLNANPFPGVSGSVTSGVFQLGEKVVQGTTLASAYLRNAPTGSTAMILAAVVGSPDNSHTWVGQTSTAVYTPTTVPTGAKSPFYGTGIAGFIAGPSSAAATFGVAGSGGVQGLTQTGGAGATAITYWVVANDTTTGTQTSPMRVLDWSSTGTDLVPVTWPRVANGADVITYDVIRAATPVGNGGVFPYNGGCGGGSGTTCGSVATSISQATACSGTLICVFQDSASVSTSAYTVNQGNYAGNLIFWPGSIVSSGFPVSVDTEQAPVTAVGLNGNPIQSARKCGAVGVAAAGGFTTCSSSVTTNSVPNQTATLMTDGSAVGGGMSLSKGRLNFNTAIGTTLQPHHIITLIDSNPGLTRATNAFRPPASANDCFIGTDVAAAGVALTAGQMSLGCPVAISTYIGATGDGTTQNWLERLTSTKKEVKVPLQIDGSTSGTVTFNASATGGVLNITAAGGFQLNSSQTLTGTQGTDSNIMTAGTVSGTGNPLCVDAGGGATTVGCGGAVSTSGALAGQGAFFTTATNITGMTDFLVNNGATHFVTIPAGSATQPGLVFASANNTGIRAVSGTLAFFAPNNATTDLTTAYERWNGTAYVNSVQITTGTGSPTLSAQETGGVLNLLGNLGTTTTNGSLTLSGGTQAPTTGSAAGIWTKGIFNPASGAANMLSFYINPTINQTSTASGTVNVLTVAPFNQGLLGAENLLVLGTASASGLSATITNNFTVDSNSNISTWGLHGENAKKGPSYCETSGGITTLNTGAATTDTGLSCLPANSVIDAVVYRITTTITTWTSFTIGDATTAARFCATQSTLTSGTTGICFAQNWSSTLAASGVQSTAAAVRITGSGGNPGAGALRLTVFYHTWTPPTS